MQRSWTDPVPQAMQRHTGTWNPSPPKAEPAPGAAAVIPQMPARRDQGLDPQVLDRLAVQTVRSPLAP